MNALFRQKMDTLDVNIRRILRLQENLTKKHALQESPTISPNTESFLDVSLPGVVTKRTRFREKVIFVDNLLVRIRFIIVMIRWTGLAPWEFEFPLPGSLTSTFLGPVQILQHPPSSTAEDDISGPGD